MSHTLTYQDDGFAGFRCGSQDAGSLDSEDRAPVACPVCGKLVRLVWNVYVEEIEAVASVPSAGETPQ